MITSAYKPLPGRFLISEPFMMDSNFQRSVVLLVEHNKEGSLGFVLNRSLNKQVHELVDGFPTSRAEVFVGGPVEQDTLHYVHMDAQLKGSRPVVENMYWSGDFMEIREKLMLGTLRDENILFFVGYSGWGPGQLERELSEKSWIVAPHNIDFVFGNEQEQLWQKVLRSMGKKFHVLSNYPTDPSLN
ncbi:MAG: YqgE/AlgH family protein [Bacteroidia bacterium]|nr:YqgE/AlgH family protein [Bacteroidia bacterium]